MLGLLATFAAAPADAQDTIVVTGSRTEPAAAGITVLDEDDIERNQPATALEPLDLIAGVRAFSKGGLSYLSLRGGDPNFTLVLLDGVRVNDPTNSRGGAFDFEQIDPFALERIELARSALSAVHGADALSGVVHLRLRSPQPGESFASARTMADTGGAAGLNATAAHGWSDGGLLASASWFDSGDLFEGVDLRRWQGFARVKQQLHGVGLSALGLHGEGQRRAFPEDSGGPRLAVVRERERRDTSLSLASVELTRTADARVLPRLALNWSRQSSDADTPPIAPGVLPGVPQIVADSRFDRIEAVADVRLRPAQTLTIAAGVSWIHEKGESEGFIDVGFPLPADFSIERTVRSLFGEATFTLGPANLTGGFRFDDPSSAADALTGRVGVRLALGRATVAFADYSEGYKLPSLFALAYPVIANPDLEPERGRTLSLGLERRIGSGQLRLALFESRFGNLIDFDVERFTNVNRANVRSRGVEIEGTVPLSRRLGAKAALTYMDVDNDPGAPPLRSRPEWQGAGVLDWSASDRLNVSFTGRFNSRFYDSSIPTGLIVQPGHVELDVTAKYGLSRALTLWLTGRNLTSESYSDSLGFPAPERTLRLGISSEF